MSFFTGGAAAVGLEACAESRLVSVPMALAECLRCLLCYKVPAYPILRAFREEPLHDGLVSGGSRHW